MNLCSGLMAVFRSCRRVDPLAAGGVQITREEFLHKMLQAGTMIEIGADPDYWAGYRRGLRLRFHGDSFGTREMHQRITSQSESRDPAIAEFARGYREGFSFNC